MENKKYETKEFLNRLSDEELKELIVLCNKTEKLDASNKRMNVENINLHIYHSKEEWAFRDYVIIEAFIGTYPSLRKTYELDDFTMRDITGYSKEAYDTLLHKFLASKFGEEYVDELFKKRVSDALKEKEILISHYNNSMSERGSILSKNLKFYEDIYFLNNYK